ncbi:hypothetical protein PO656_20370 [Enterobacter kobei]|uniref:hypothetical protein n=1 Tax=Enterobacter kobei TaxID=208224 RepID=UPI0029354BEB|nr:hypothetical protein [Enterobacter kobei]
MTRNNIIGTYRRRILKAALIRHQRKTGSTCIVITQPRGGITTLELTEIVMDGLLSRFEKLARGEYGSVNGDKAIIAIYKDAVDVNGYGEHLTESGKLLVDDLVAELVSHAKKAAAAAGSNKSDRNSEVKDRT